MKHKSSTCLSKMVPGLALAVLLGIGLSPQAQSAEPAAAKEAKDLVLKGDAKCTSCHDEADEPTPSMISTNSGVLRIGKTKHGTVADKRSPTCTNCHGESKEHTAHKGSGKPPAPDISFLKNSKNTMTARNESCLSCHSGGKQTHWNMSSHASRDTGCTSCHSVHNPHDKVRDKRTQPEVCYTCHKEQRAQVNRPSHHPIPEGKMSCSDCHSPHGSAGAKNLVRDSVNDTCYTCHMEKRGPFVHNHQPVTEDCSICHNPHGSTITGLLKSRPPFLCQECHSHTSHPGQVAALPTARTTSTTALGTVGRGCLNCHTNIHGGNSTQNSATAGRFRR